MSHAIAITIEQMLGGQKTLKSPLHTYEDQMSLIEKGMPVIALKAFVNYISLSMDEIASFLHVSKRTLERNTTLSVLASDQLLRIAEIYAKGFDVFTDQAMFKRWMDTPNQALCNKQPKDLLSNSIGRQMIYDVLCRIEYGVYS
jgi:putative toxin-antitoxin system antitoxin component (TIGR02293 family)